MDIEALKALEQRILDDLGYSVHLCAEIEYGFAHTGSVPDAFWLNLLEKAQKADVPLASFGREKTRRDDVQQYECRFTHTGAVQAADALLWLNPQLPALAKKHKIELLSFAESNKRSVFCGLHWHLHLLNDEGNYCFFKQEEELSDPLQWTLGGLLETMPALMPCFAPDEAAFVRLNSGADHIPRTLSWGGNNRSCALRLPESVVPHRHIEHRVCGANADPIASVWALLVGIHYGIANKCKVPAQCYSDANREALTALPMSLEDAQEAQENADWLKAYAP